MSIADVGSALDGKENGQMKRLSAVLAIAALSLGILLLPGASPLTAEEHMDMEKMISAAKTAADHEAIAAQYEREAAAARAEAAEHRKMAESYKKVGGAGIGKLHLDAHCEKLAKSYDEVAQQDEELAKAHREMAKSAK
jgi:hypothetical protein